MFVVEAPSFNFYHQKEKEKSPISGAFFSFFLTVIPGSCWLLPLIPP